MKLGLGMVILPPRPAMLAGLPLFVGELPSATWRAVEQTAVATVPPPRGAR